ncbi:MAG: undecaprenyl-phosphate glucose phosphotransferase [Candidatus Poribacteria bacterium]|nr:undecaprenyl-phosphate glucose phosphotransferase [Candidatus Poribacteria bacterium]
MSKKTLDHLLILFTVLCDLCFIATSIVVAYWIRFESGLLDTLALHKGGTPPFNDYIRLIPVTVIIWMVTLNGFKLYRQEDNATLLSFWRLTQASCIALIGTLAALFFIYHHVPYSRWVMLLGTCFNFVFLFLIRLVLFRFRQSIQAHGVGVSRIALVGYDERGSKFIDALSVRQNSGYKLVGLIDGANTVQKKCADDSEGEYLGSSEEILQIVQEHRLDMLYIVSPSVSNDTIMEIMYACEGIPIQINVLPELSEFITGGSAVTFFEGQPVLQLRETPMQGVSGIIKRLIDIVFSLFALIVLSPLMLIIAAVIRITSPGKAIFLQERVGRAGKRFNIYKFRSMRVDAEANIGHVWAKTDDPRQTELGKFLRRWSLDELPQFLNVLKGDMSLVGPRPEMSGLIGTFQESIPHYLARQRVKSGMTGWAQVNGFRGNTSLEDRVNSDRYYIENWSIALDIKIILRTVWAIIQG